MSQQSLPFQPHSETSHDAAEKAEPHAGTERARVLAHLESVGTYGATDEEIQIALGMNPSTQRPRRVELQKAGQVEEACNVFGQKLQRKTTSGRNAQVWRIKR